MTCKAANSLADDPAGSFISIQRHTADTWGCIVRL